MGGPAGLAQIARSIQSSLSNIKTNVQINIDPKAAPAVSKLNSELRKLNLTMMDTTKNMRAMTSALNNLQKAATSGNAGIAAVSKAANNQAKSTKKAADETGKLTSEMAEFGRISGLAVRRFAGFSIATGLIFGLIGAMKSAGKEAFDFQGQLVKISQVEGSTVKSLRGLQDEVTRLATTLGVSSKDLINTAQILAQAGLSARDTKVAMEALAKTTLAPTFENINSTVEGSIAIMSQFGIATKDLEKALGSTNKVAAEFAVESDDIIQAVRRAGGAFAAASAGVSQGTDAFNEFIAVFTSVRATTRESAESIATGLRTVFTRLQRTSTIDQLEELGIAMSDVEGKFIGPFKAINNIAKALESIDPRDRRFAAIAEELGGFRQISKVIPLLLQTETRMKALAAAQAGQTSLSEDAAKAQEALSVRFTKVREEFVALIREITQTDTFNALVDITLELAKNLINLARVFKPLIPLITAFAAIKLGSGFVQFGQGFKKGVTGAGGSNGMGLGLANLLGGQRFNSGGLVPGRGPNKDSIYAHLTPGEFVIQRPAVDALGVSYLNAINRNKGGIVPKFATGSTDKFTLSKSHISNNTKIQDEFGNLELSRSASKSSKAYKAVALFLQPQGIDRHISGKLPISAFAGKEGLPKGSTQRTERSLVASQFGGSDGVPFEIISASLTKNASRAFESQLKTALTGFLRNQSSGLVGPEYAFSKQKIRQSLSAGQFNFPSISGNMFEAMLASSSQPFDDKRASNSTFDFASTSPQVAKSFGLNTDESTYRGDAKRSYNDDAIGSLSKKVRNQIRNDIKLSRKAVGGSVGEDEANAMVAPGEYILGRPAVQRLGVGGARKLNNAHKKGFVTGGLFGSYPGFVDGDEVKKRQEEIKRQAEIRQNQQRIREEAARKKRERVLGPTPRNPTLADIKNRANARKLGQAPRIPGSIPGAFRPEPIVPVAPIIVPPLADSGVNRAGSSVGIDLSKPLAVVPPQPNITITSEPTGVVRANPPRPTAAGRPIPSFAASRQQAKFAEAAKAANAPDPQLQKQLDAIKKNPAANAAFIEGPLGGNFTPKTTKVTSLDAKAAAAAAKEASLSSRAFKTLAGSMKKAKDGTSNMVSGLGQYVAKAQAKVKAEDALLAKISSGKASDKEIAQGQSITQRREAKSTRRAIALAGTIAAAGFLQQGLQAEGERTGNANLSGVGAALGGGITGAALGAQVGGPVGAIIGGTLGAASSGISAFKNALESIANKKHEDSINKLTNSLDKLSSSSTDFAENLKGVSAAIGQARESAINVAATRNQNELGTFGQLTNVGLAFGAFGDTREENDSFKTDNKLAALGGAGFTTFIGERIGNISSKRERREAARRGRSLLGGEVLEGHRVEIGAAENSVQEALKRGVSLDDLLKDRDLVAGLAFKDKKAGEAFSLQDRIDDLDVTPAERLTILYKEGEPALRKYAEESLKRITLEKKLADASKLAAESVDLMIKRFTDLNSRIQASNEQLSYFFIESQANLAALRGEFEAKQEPVNVFKNIRGFSEDRVNQEAASLAKVLNRAGKTQEANDITTSVSVAKQLQTVLPKAIGDVLNTGLLEGSSATEVFSTIEDALTSRLGVAELPKAIRDSLRSQVFKTLEGDRQQQVGAEEKIQELRDIDTTSITEAALSNAATLADGLAAFNKKFSDVLTQRLEIERRITDGVNQAAAGRIDADAKISALLDKDTPDNIRAFGRRRASVFTGGETDPSKILATIKAQGTQLQAARDSFSSNPKDIVAFTEIARLTNEMAKNREALKALTDTSAELEATQKELAELDRKKETAGKTLKQLATGGPEEQLEFRRRLALGGRLAAGGQLRGDALGQGLAGLEEFGDLLESLDIIKKDKRKNLDRAGNEAIVGALPQDLRDFFAKQGKSEDFIADRLSGDDRGTVVEKLKEAQDKALIAQGALTQATDLNREALDANTNALRRLFASRPTEEIGKSAGGRIFGYGNKDSVRARLTPGEYVVNKASASKYMPLLAAINAGAVPSQKMASGGVAQRRYINEYSSGGQQRGYNSEIEYQYANTNAVDKVLNRGFNDDSLPFNQRFVPGVGAAGPYDIMQDGVLYRATPAEIAQREQADAVERAEEEAKRRNSDSYRNRRDPVRPPVPVARGASDFISGIVSRGGVALSDGISNAATNIANGIQSPNQVSGGYLPPGLKLDTETQNQIVADARLAAGYPGPGAHLPAGPQTAPIVSGRKLTPQEMLDNRAARRYNSQTPLFRAANTFDQFQEQIKAGPVGAIASRTNRRTAEQEKRKQRAATRLSNDSKVGSTKPAANRLSRDEIAAKVAAAKQAGFGAGTGAAGKAAGKAVYKTSISGDGTETVTYQDGSTEVRRRTALNNRSGQASRFDGTALAAAREATIAGDERRAKEAADAPGRRQKTAAQAAAIRNARATLKGVATFGFTPSQKAAARSARQLLLDNGLVREAEQFTNAGRRLQETNQERASNKSFQALYPGYDSSSPEERRSKDIVTINYLGTGYSSKEEGEAKLKGLRSQLEEANKPKKPQSVNGFRTRTRPRGYALGGGVPGIGNSDIVPAILTPGEFVLNKKAVQALGMNNLHTFNNKFNKGGSVVPQRLNSGGAASGGWNFSGLERILPSFATSITLASDTLTKTVDALNKLSGLKVTHEVTIARQEVVVSTPDLQGNFEAQILDRVTTMIQQVVGQQQVLENAPGGVENIPGRSA
jgi:TP901 family phage tail tape measure protein